MRFPTTAFTPPSPPARFQLTDQMFVSHVSGRPPDDQLFELTLSPSGILFITGPYFFMPRKAWINNTGRRFSFGSPKVRLKGYEVATKGDFGDALEGVERSPVIIEVIEGDQDWKHYRTIYAEVVRM